MIVNKRYGVVQTLVSVLMFFLVLAVVGGYGFAETKDANAKKQAEWQEIFIDKGYSYTWCGNRQLILEFGEKKPRLVDIHTKDIHELLIEADYYGCSPDGRYVFSQKAKDCGGLVVYDTRIKQAQCLIQKKDSRQFFSYGSPTLLSPDGRYLAWYSRGDIKLSGGELLTLIPILENDMISRESIAWSPDSKKLILLTGSTSHLDDLRGTPKQYLILYDVLTNIRTTLKFEFKGDFYGKRIKISPDGKKLYIEAILEEFGKGYLLVLDLFKLDPTKLTVRPVLLKDGIWSFDVGVDNLIVLHTFPDPEVPTNKPPNIKTAGLYLADSRGKIIQRLTSNTIDLYPKFSRDGRAIAFRRTTVKPWTESIYVLLKTD